MFFDEENGGPDIDKSAFNDLINDSRVRVEWFDDSNSNTLVRVDYIIRDGRLHKHLFHPLSFIISLKYRNGDDRCKVHFGGYSYDPRLEKLINNLNSLTRKLVSKTQLISIIKRSVNIYQKNVVEFHLVNYYGSRQGDSFRQRDDGFPPLNQSLLDNDDGAGFDGYLHELLLEK